MTGFTLTESRAWLDAIAKQDQRSLRPGVLDAELAALFIGVSELKPPEQAARKLLEVLDKATETAR